MRVRELRKSIYRYGSEDHVLIWFTKTYIPRIEKLKKREALISLKTIRTISKTTTNIDYLIPVTVSPDDSVNLFVLQLTILMLRSYSRFINCQMYFESLLWIRFAVESLECLFIISVPLFTCTCSHANVVCCVVLRCVVLRCLMWQLPCT